MQLPWGSVSWGIRHIVLRGTLIWHHMRNGGWITGEVYGEQPRRTIHWEGMKYLYLFSEGRNVDAKLCKGFSGTALGPLGYSDVHCTFLVLLRSLFGCLRRHHFSGCRGHHIRNKHSAFIVHALLLICWAAAVSAVPPCFPRSPHTSQLLQLLDHSHSFCPVMRWLLFLGHPYHHIHKQEMI